MDTFLACVAVIIALAACAIALLAIASRFGVSPEDALAAGIAAVSVSLCIATVRLAVDE
jgi:hypothetical protein